MSIFLNNLVAKQFLNYKYLFRQHGFRFKCDYFQLITDPTINSTRDFNCVPPLIWKGFKAAKKMKWCHNGDGSKACKFTESNNPL